jgi:hypothetical protein
MWGLFDKFMKYLHDNGSKVLTLKQIGYDTITDTFHLTGIHKVNQYVVMQYLFEWI